MLRWEKQSGGGWYAYSGSLIIGMVVEVGAGVNAGKFVYEISAVHTKWTGKGRGYVKTAVQARRSLTKAWAAWLERASLQPVNK